MKDECSSQVARLTIAEVLFFLREQIYHLAHLDHYRTPIRRYGDHESSFGVIEHFKQVIAAVLIEQVEVTKWVVEQLAA